jgi:uncharacterized protein (TIGR00369 family)
MLEPSAGTAVPPWREPARGGYPDPEMLVRSGAEQLEAMLTGRSPQPPLAHLVGMRLVEYGSGTAVQEMPLSGWLCSPQGAITIGALVIPADAAMACAIQSVLPGGTPFTTWELSLRVLAPARPGSSLIARGSLIQMRRRIVLAEVSLTDEHGRLIAHGSSLCFMLGQDRRPEPPQPTGDSPTAAGGAAATDPGSSPDPHARPPQGEVVDQSVWERMSGLEVLRARIAGELPAPPITYLTGLEVVSAAEGEAVFSMPATEWLAAPPRGRAQGGTVALLAETALGSAIQTTVPAGTALAPVDLKVNYLRPLATDGRAAVATGRVTHAGRTIAVASAEVLDADGRAIAVATGSALVLPGRAASLAFLEDR